MTTPILGLSEIAEGVASQASLHNTALREFEARTIRVKSRTTTAPPGSPAESDSYIIPAGTWAGAVNQIASFIGGAWGYYTPLEGVTVWVNDEDKIVTFNSTLWVISGGASGGDVIGPASAIDGRLALFDGVSGKLIKAGSAPPTGTNTGDQTSVTGNAGTATALQTARTIGGTLFDGTANITQPYDVGGSYTGAPTASVVLMRFKFPRTVVFAAGLAPSQAASTNPAVAATAQTDFDIQKNGVSVGTMRWAAAGTVASFIMASQTTFNIGDVVAIIGPATPDATLANLAYCLSGTR